MFWKLLLLFLLCQQLLGSDDNQCDFTLNQDSFFSVAQLKASKHYEFYVNQQQYIMFNFCETIDSKCKDQKQDNSFATYIDEQTQSCYPLTFSQDKQIYSYSLIDDLNASTGIIIDFLGESEYKFKIQLYCKSNLAKSIHIQKLMIDKKQITLFAESPFGCPIFEISRIWRFFDSYKIILGVLLIALGLALNLLGIKLMDLTIFFSGFLTGLAFIMALLQELFLTVESSSKVIWFLLVISLVLGFLFGYVCMNIKILGFAQLGLWLGIVISFLLNNAVLYMIPGFWAIISLWITIGILATVFGILSIKMPRHLCIWGSATLGSYLIVRSMSWFIGYFPNEFHVSDYYQHNIKSVPNQFYLYLVIIICLSAVGMWVQYKLYFIVKRKEDEKDQNDYIIFQELQNNLGGKLKLQQSDKNPSEEPPENDKKTQLKEKQKLEKQQKEQEKKEKEQKEKEKKEQEKRDKDQQNEKQKKEKEQQKQEKEKVKSMEKLVKEEKKTKKEKPKVNEDNQEQN